MEFALIDLIQSHLDITRNDVATGIGDDAALLRVPDGFELAVSVDTLVKGVHFLPEIEPFKLGWKSLAVNLSDMAAMGAEPAWVTLALTLPQADEAFIDAFSSGFAALARQYNVALVGGDTTQGPLAVSITVHGLVPKGQALLRQGAQPGDKIYVTGDLGDAASALHCLDNTSSAARYLKDKLSRPVPHVGAGRALRGLAHAAIDISDGLLSEVRHICRASEVGATIHLDQLPCSQPLIEIFGEDKARHFALIGGDVYALCFTVAANKADQAKVDLATAGFPAICVGEIVTNQDVHVVDKHGHSLPIRDNGWEHFRL